MEATKAASVRDCTPVSLLCATALTICLLHSRARGVAGLKVLLVCLYFRTRPIVNVDATLAAILRGVNETLNLDVLECDDHPWYVQYVLYLLSVCKWILWSVLFCMAVYII